MSESRVESVKRQLESTQRVHIAAKSSHLNNNGLPITATGGQTNSSGEIKQDIKRHQGVESCLLDEINKHDNESVASQSNESEDWQMIDMDEQVLSSGVSHHNNNNITSNHNNNNLYEEEVLLTKKRQEKKYKPRKYVDIDPLGPKQQYSPALVHLYTAIYSLLPLASFLTLFALVALLFTRLFFISLIYFSYIFIYDRNTCNRGGRRVESIYRSKFWSYLAAYFPIRLRHTSEFKLDPSENYILNYHPHGISAFGAVTAFATNGLNFSELFPGITARFMVHETSFRIPVMRETFALRGDCSVNSRSIDYILSDKKKTGNLLTIVVGGLAEADLSDAEVLKIVVAQRKGFVKKALIHGANIIPCIAFGENSVFKKVNLKPDSFWYRCESRWYDLFKFKHPIYYGRSIFSNKKKGIMPYKRPITVVMGDPIKVDRLANPTNEQIDELHKIYLNELKAMYDANSEFHVEYDKVLEII